MRTVILEIVELGLEIFKIKQAFTIEFKMNIQSSLDLIPIRNYSNNKTFMLRIKKKI